MEAPTIGDGDVIGVGNSARFQRAVNLTHAIELNPNLLIDLKCEEIQEWLDLGTFEIDQSVLQKLDEAFSQLDHQSKERIIIVNYNEDSNLNAAGSPCN